jgi:hypothetical protein
MREIPCCHPGFVAPLLFLPFLDLGAHHRIGLYLLEVILFCSAGSLDVEGMAFDWLIGCTAGVSRLSPVMLLMFSNFCKFHFSEILSFLVLIVPV